MMSRREKRNCEATQKDLLSITRRKKRKCEVAQIYFLSIPRDILIEIAAFVSDPIDWINFKLVCKTFLEISENTHDITKYKKNPLVVLAKRQKQELFKKLLNNKFIKKAMETGESNNPILWNQVSESVISPPSEDLLNKEVFEKVPFTQIVLNKLFSTYNTELLEYTMHVINKEKVIISELMFIAALDYNGAVIEMQRYDHCRFFISLFKYNLDFGILFKHVFNGIPSYSGYRICFLNGIIKLNGNKMPELTNAILYNCCKSVISAGKLEELEIFSRLNNFDPNCRKYVDLFSFLDLHVEKEHILFFLLSHKKTKLTRDFSNLLLSCREEYLVYYISMTDLKANLHIDILKYAQGSDLKKRIKLLARINKINLNSIDKKMIIEAAKLDLLKIIKPLLPELIRIDNTIKDSLLQLIYEDASESKIESVDDLIFLLIQYPEFDILYHDPKYFLEYCKNGKFEGATACSNRNFTEGSVVYKAFELAYTNKHLDIVHFLVINSSSLSISAEFYNSLHYLSKSNVLMAIKMLKFDTLRAELERGLRKKEKKSIDTFNILREFTKDCTNINTNNIGDLIRCMNVYLSNL
jgi:hypothetical protein